MSGAARAWRPWPPGWRPGTPTEGQLAAARRAESPPRAAGGERGGGGGLPRPLPWIRGGASLLPYHEHTGKLSRIVQLLPAERDRRSASCRPAVADWAGRVRGQRSENPVPHGHQVYTRESAPVRQRRQATSDSFLPLTLWELRTALRYRTATGPPGLRGCCHGARRRKYILRHRSRRTNYIQPTPGTQRRGKGGRIRDAAALDPWL